MFLTPKPVKIHLNTNINRPRENLSNLKGKIPGQVWDKLARARGAHLNAMEGIPMFAAAMVSNYMPDQYRRC